MFIYEDTNNLNSHYCHIVFLTKFIKKIDIKYDTYIIIIVTSII